MERAHPPGLTAAAPAVGDNQCHVVFLSASVSGFCSNQGSRCLSLEVTLARTHQPWPGSSDDPSEVFSRNMHTCVGWG